MKKSAALKVIQKTGELTADQINEVDLEIEKALAFLDALECIDYSRGLLKNTVRVITIEASNSVSRIAEILHGEEEQ